LVLACAAASLAEHDLSAKDATLLAKETADFENITADPSAAISGDLPPPNLNRSPRQPKCLQNKEGRHSGSPCAWEVNEERFTLLIGISCISADQSPPPSSAGMVYALSLLSAFSFQLSASTPHFRLPRCS
jgi:hypothetical protein